MDKSEKSAILYIDDNHDNLRLVERFLSGSNYDVITADNGLEGLKIVGTAKPGLILLDIMMPEMNGYEVCSRLQENNETAYIPVIFLTALGEEQDKAKAFSVGAVDYLVKPIQKDLLIEKVSTHLQTHTRWKKMHEDTKSWHERIQPADFIRFKKFLFEKLNLNPEEKIKFKNIPPSKIYSISSDIGINDSKMAQYIAKFLKLPYASHINPEAVRTGVLATAFCKANHVLPIKDDSNREAYVLIHPFDWELLDTMMKFSGQDKTCNIIITEPSNIESVFDYYSPKRVGPDSLIKDKPEIEKTVIETASKLSEAEIRKHPVVHIANNIIATAANERASDIHIEPKEDKTLIRFRIDGDLREMFSLKKNTGIKLITRFKALGGLDITEKRKPQDGSSAATIDGRTFILRLSTTSTPCGESLVMRILEPDIKPKELTELGMVDRQISTLIKAANRKAGLILIVGGTGSGKTTTIYSLLSKVDCETSSLMSVEDPIEYRIPLANQQQVNEKAGVTFDALLKASVRQDPDILYMGEVRDNYSAKMAIDFASTGHLTVTTLHTSNATTAIFRLERLGIERSIMADTILVIVAQRLLKKLCPNCKKIVPISQEEVEMLSPYTNDIPSHVAHPVGCQECNDTGYYGREGIYEIIEFDAAISEMVRMREPISKIRSFVQERGDYLISNHALEKVKSFTFSTKDIYENVLIEEIDFKKAKAIETISETSLADEIKEKEQTSILVVEDDEDNRKLIVRFLENQGYNVVTAEDGIEAILCLGKEQFDLILSDADMPNLNGFKLLEMISQKGIKTPVIFITSWDSPEDEEKGLKLGAMDYIKKPVQKEILLLRVGRVIDNARKQSTG